MGKNLGDDLREGKTTLPLIVAMQKASPTDQALIRTAIEEGDVSQLGEVSRIVKSSGALNASLDFAKVQAQRAMDALEPLSDGAYKAALLELPLLSLARKS